LNNSPDHGADEKGQPGTDPAALFAFDDPFDPGRRVPPRRLLYPVVLPLVVLLMLAAVTFDDAVHPPLWVHLLAWPPVVLLVIGGAVRLVQRLAPPRNGEGDHPLRLLLAQPLRINCAQRAQGGGGVPAQSAILSSDSPGRKTPPPRCARSPSPGRGGLA
jgi:hypothetical protein